MTDKKLDTINSEIQTIDRQLKGVENQLRQARNLQEETFYRGRDSHVFMNDLQNEWYQDEKLGSWLSEMDVELEHRFNDITRRLEVQEEELQGQKRQLENKSEALVFERRKLY